MKRGTANTEYRCVCCDKSYDKKEDAEECSKYTPVIRKGDIIMVHACPRVVTYEPGDTGFATVEAIPEYFKASGAYKIKGDPTRLATPLTYFCNNKPVKRFSITDAKRYVKERSNQLKAANTLLQMIVDQQPLGDDDDDFGFNARKTRVARKNDRATKRLPKKGVRKSSL